MDKNELKQEFGQLTTEFFAALETKMKEGNKPDPILDEKLAKLNAKFDEIETKLYRPNLNGKPAGQEGVTEESKAFGALLRRGPAFLKPEQKGLIRFNANVGSQGPEEVKILTESDDTGGGYLAPPEFVAEIIKGIVVYSPVRNLARVRTTGMRSVRIPKRTGTGAASWLSEIGTRTENASPTYGMVEIPVHELVAMSDISNQDLEDSAFDLNAELQQEFSEQLAKAEGTAFVNGTGAGQPEGIMTNQAVPVQVSGNAATLSFAGYVNTAHAIASFYAPNAIWGMNRKTLGATRQILDSSNRPIWQNFSSSGMDSANPPQILGIPYQELPDMPNVGASTYPVVLADWKRAYYIVDRINIEIQRDPFTQNTKGVTRFIGRKRVGAQTAVVEAAIKMQCHT